MKKTNEEIIAEIKDILWNYTYIIDYPATTAIEKIIDIFIREGIING